MQLTYFGHASFLLTVGNVRVLFDPFISPNPLAKDINVGAIEADYILVSHGHGDHIADVEAIGKRTGAKVLAIAEIAGYFGAKGLDVIGTNLGGKVVLPFGTVHCVAAAHSSSFPDGSYAGVAMGFVIKTTEGQTIYFAGDTALTYDLKLIKERHKVDVALLPIGDNYTMGITDALVAADWVGTTEIIGMHYDTFPVIAIDHDAVLAEAKAAGKNLRLLRIGESITL
ncbi:metal-dependent hydrolase [Hymenobacter sp. BRD67]|uniref:metal-dependent hydrolase n=1 Tax=Hymenobacter sp. BRD67 TaxID=2675877 RepID=UPI0015666411|nr:metal-dependent hydrolase [Hymenobacter sp. BRD67]QKG51262.1 metal-dependent hydrolase [Hymenobacter sp. BRD67]